MLTRLTLAVLLVQGLAVFVGAESQRFCYKRVGYTRKQGETYYVHRRVAVEDENCDSAEGRPCRKYVVVSEPATQLKTELVFRTERHCCPGYQRDARRPDACVPVCAAGCPQGEKCVAPNRCEGQTGGKPDGARAGLEISQLQSLPGTAERKPLNSTETDDSTDERIKILWGPDSTNSSRYQPSENVAEYCSGPQARIALDLKPTVSLSASDWIKSNPTNCSWGFEVPSRSTLGMTAVSISS